MIKNFQLFQVKYLGATNTKGSRVSIKDTRFKQLVVIPYDYSFNSAMDIAINYLKERGYNVIGRAENEVLADDFKPLRGEKKNAKH